MEDTTDQQLLERARAGDGYALETLLARHQRSIYRYGMKMCKDPEDARDVLQDTLLAAARGVRDFRGESSLSTWLYTIARSYCIRRRRTAADRSGRERSVDVDAAERAAELTDPAKTPEEVAATREVEHAVEHAIATLEPAYREVLLLRDVEGLSAPEVAEVTGLSVQAVKSRLHRARVALRGRIAPLLGISGTPPRAAADCPDVLTLMSQHLEGEISAEVCARMQSHVAACPRCRGACESLQRTLAICRASEPPEVPAAVQADVRRALHDLATGS